MSPVTTSAIAHHVETAKRLLDTLEQHAEAALDALGVDDAQFMASVAERDRVLAELNNVVAAIAHERPTGDAVDSALLAEMARAASTALESHDTLMGRTQAERDRLAAALDRAKRPDQVANQYAVATSGPRTATLSVTG